ncbi:MAG: hypothetical protein LBQ33_06375 [Oscillospiraceae bacterium]|nr:hypothetical protein [Oscillospiraceae bacterium]
MFLGIDGGGTKTRAVAVTRAGALAARAAAGSINFHSVGWAAARGELAALLRQLQAQAPGALESVFIGNAALFEEAAPEQLHRLTEGILEAHCLAMESDLAIALEALEGDGSVAVAISGTGSMTAGRAARAAPLITAGGWGYLLGDEGSGFHLAWKGLRAALRGMEGSAPPTDLTAALFSFAGVNSAASILDVFYHPPMERSELADFAKRVLSCAEAGDAAAIDIVRQCTADFAQTVLSLLRKLPDAPRLGLWGGVMQHSVLFRRAFCDAIHARLPQVEAALLPCAPEVGAVFAAFRRAGLVLEPHLREKIIAQCCGSNI